MHSIAIEQKCQELLSDVEVKTALPKLESEYAVEMSDILKAMGMTDSFDMDLADFTELGKSEDGTIFISRVIHKTYIAVDEKGTKTGAASAVEGSAAGALLENPKTVYLDRPWSAYRLAVRMLIFRKLHIAADSFIFYQNLT